MTEETDPGLARIIEGDNRDPWKHRAAGMRCRTCMWYAQKAKRVGRCRRHAPTMNGYPVVYEIDWCGDHKLDEEKAL